MSLAIKEHCYIAEKLPGDTPVPLGRLTVARSCWSAYFVSMLRRAWNSTVSGNFREAVDKTACRASAGSMYCVLGGTLVFCSLKRRDLFLSFAGAFWTVTSSSSSPVAHGKPCVKSHSYCCNHLLMRPEPRSP